MRSTICVAGAVLATALASAAAAQSFPARPLRLVVTSPPGGANDIQSRIIALKLAERLGQPVVIDNRGGASGMLAAEIVAKAPADGYTLLGGTNSTFSVNPTLFPKIAYAVSDFAPVSVTVMTPHVLLVHPSLPAKSVRELVALARAQPGKLNYASSGAGSAFHLGMELLKTAANLQIVHVPFKGSALSVNAMLAGDVQMMLIGMATGIPLAKSGRARLLAVANPQRSALAPDVPTIAESGVPGYGYLSWFGIVARAGTPRPVIAALHQGVDHVLKQPDVRERLAAQGYEVISTTPAGMTEKIREDSKKWANVIRASGAKPE